MFNSIVKEASEKFDTGDKTKTLLAALLRLIDDAGGGGLQGFVEKFRRAGSGDLVDSWIRIGDNRAISNARLEATLGTNALGSIAGQVGVDRTTATTVLGFMTPRVIDALTPNGDLPDESDLSKKLKKFSGTGRSAALIKYLLPFAVLLAVIGYFVFKSHP